jgi:hypothetical protein
MAPLRSQFSTFIALLCLAQSLPAEESLENILRTVLDPGSQGDVPFRDVIRLSTGRKILPLDPGNEPDRRLLEILTSALDETLARFNRPDSPTCRETRINEVSIHFERALRETIDRHPEFTCVRPETASGAVQSSGYPDLLIRHEPSGRIAYLDPKLVQAGSLSSSLRTFYFTPRVETNKVRHDAHHLLAGIEHDGRVGAWKFTGWKLVDLYGFCVHLKAEYQASNRAVYRDELILRASTPNPAKVSPP